MLILKKSLFLFSLLLQPSTSLDYSQAENPVVEWYRTDSMSLPGPKNDASNTLLWFNGIAHLFYNYWSLEDGRAYSVMATGRDIASLNVEKMLTIDEDANAAFRWFESILPGEDGYLYAFYHSEERNPCGFYIKTPEIGMAISKDQGHTWKNLGVVVKNHDEENDCSALNGFFSNGTGDFAALYDRDKKYVYIVYTNYPMQQQANTQGISTARIAASELANPVGKAYKWYKGSYSEPGVDGKSSSIFKPKINFRHSNPDAYWGPSIHYNTFINKYVMVMTRTKNGKSTKELWPTEGIYVSVNDDMANPYGWSKPERLTHGGRWYPQFIGFNKYTQDHTAEIGEWARFFMEGHSDYIVRFKK